MLSHGSEGGRIITSFNIDYIHITDKLTWKIVLHRNRNLAKAVCIVTQT